MVGLVALENAAIYPFVQDDTGEETLPRLYGLEGAVMALPYCAPPLPYPSRCSPR